MFDIGWSEMLVIAIVMIVVVGPKDLPKMLRTFGKTTSKLRAMAGDFRKQFDEALKDAELDDVKDLVNEARSLNPANSLRDALDPMRRAADDVRAGLNSAMKPAEAQQVAAADAQPSAEEPLKTGATGLPEGMTKPADMSKVNAAQAKQMKSQADALAARVEAAAKAGAAKAEKAKAASAPVAAAPAPKPVARSTAKTAAKPRSAAAANPAKAPATAKVAKAAAKPAAPKAPAVRKTNGKTK